MGKNGSVRRAFTVSGADYRLLEEVGYGANAVVYRAIYLPTNEVVAVKCLDLDRVNSSLDDVRKEAQTMSLIDHPNVVRAYCSFVVDHSLWVVMPFMAEGSCLHLMKIAYPDGFEEPVIGSVLKETLKALDYLHKQGHIHRDVKSGNILIDKPGVVKLGDFGVSACMFDKGDRQRSRNTFVGTPCWMAPEVLQPGAGYDFKADIWSFGITALELAHGHAPFSKYPPMKVLLMTLQNAPPGLDYDRDKRFSKAFKEMVAMCLVKDQTKRPTAEKLLKHSFFKSAKSPESTLKRIIDDLPPLWDRVKALQLKDAAQLALKKMPSSEQEAISLSEYQRGVSAWKFDIDDLKAQASLIRDDDPPEIKEHEEKAKSIEVEKDSSSSKSTLGKPISANENSCRDRTCSTLTNPDAKCSSAKEALVADISHITNKSRIDVHDKPRSEDSSVPSTSKLDNEQKHSKSEVGKKQQAYSGPLVYSGMQNSSTAERARGSERSNAGGQVVADKHKHEARRPNLSGPLSLPTRASANSLSAPIRTSGGYLDSFGDKNKRNVVAIKGRFSVTSENVDLAKVQEIPIGTLSHRSQQESPLKKSASVGEWQINAKPMQNNQHLKELCNNTVSASILIPHLQNLVQQTTLQQDLIMNLLGSLQHSEVVDATHGGIPSQTQSTESDTVVDTASAQREHLLLVKISELQARMIALTDELIAAKLKHVQLQRQLGALHSREEIEETGHEEVEET